MLRRWIGCLHLCQPRMTGRTHLEPVSGELLARGWLFAGAGRSYRPLRAGPNAYARNAALWRGRVSPCIRTNDQRVSVFLWTGVLFGMVWVFWGSGGFFGCLFLSSRCFWCLVGVLGAWGCVRSVCKQNQRLPHICKTCPILAGCSLNSVSFGFLGANSNCSVPGERTELGFKAVRIVREFCRHGIFSCSTGPSSILFYVYTNGCVFSVLHYMRAYNILIYIYIYVCVHVIY